MRPFGRALIMGSALALFPLSDLALALIALPVIGVVLDSMIAPGQPAPESARG